MRSNYVEYLICLMKEISILYKEEKIDGKLAADYIRFLNNKIIETNNCKEDVDEQTVLYRKIGNMITNEVNDQKVLDCISNMQLNTDMKIFCNNDALLKKSKVAINLLMSMGNSLEGLLEILEGRGENNEYIRR